MRKILILLPIAVLALSITYAGFSSTLDIGNDVQPNTVHTGTLKWSLYLPSELGLPLPDVLDAEYISTSSYILNITSNGVYTTPVIIPENPNIGSASISKKGDTVHITLKNVYPGYGAVTHFIYVNTGTIPSELKSVNLTLNDPYNLAKDVRVAALLTWSTAGNSYPVYGIYFIGYNLTDFPRLIEQALGGKVFQPGGWIAFCKPKNTTVTITSIRVNPNSGLPQDLVNYLNNTDSFWIWIPPDTKPPQGAWLSFNLTLTFGQFNE